MKSIFKFSSFLYLFFACLLFLSILGFCFIDVSKSPSLVNEKNVGACKTYNQHSVIDTTKTLNIAVWNIYKQQNSGWDSQLIKLTNRNQIILLQEAISSMDLLSTSDWHINQAYGFAILNEIAGVMTLSKGTPDEVCAYSQAEPIFRVPKTALLSYFPLSNGKQLAVINIHSINFTLALDSFKAQILNIMSKITAFDGPIIFAGDFNTWSQERLSLLKKEFAKINLQQAGFSPDERLTAFGQPLDHVFYRDLTLVRAQSKSTHASDHAFLEVNFRFK